MSRDLLEMTIAGWDVDPFDVNTADVDSRFLEVEFVEFQNEEAARGRFKSDRQNS